MLHHAVITNFLNNLSIISCKKKSTQRAAVRNIDSGDILNWPFEPDEEKKTEKTRNHQYDSSVEIETFQHFLHVHQK